MKNSCKRDGFFGNSILNDVTIFNGIDLLKEATKVK
jgi:hypothetical protein